MAALIIWPLLLAFAQAGPAVYDVTASASESVNEGGSPGLKQAKLSGTRSIACYTDYSAGNGSARGKCSLMEILSGSIEKLGDVVFEDATVVPQSISVAAFSENDVIVCFTGVTQHVICNLVSIDNTDLALEDSVEIDNESIGSTYVAVAKMASTSGVVCYSCAGCATAAEGKCSKLSLVSGSDLDAGNPVSFTDGQTASHIAIEPLEAEERAVLCYNEGGSARCLLLDDTGAPAPGTVSTFFESDEADFGSITTNTIGDYGMVCFTDSPDNGNFAACKTYQVVSEMLVLSTNYTIVSDSDASSLQVATLSDENGIVCYVDLNTELADVNGQAGPATCKVLSVDGGELSCGPANVVNDQTEYFSLVGLSAQATSMCYSDDGAGGAACVALNMAETTTTQTSTDTHTSTRTMTASDTSGTSQTLSSSGTTATTDTSTTSPHTTTVTETTTSPHTTTITSVTETTVSTTIELSLSVSSACLSAAAMLFVVLGAVA
ncbi:unnamed protein product [Prorocentrum cordatum]|uniref:Subtilisin n=1 Tax=Prorocentrum cordatum TaxID=2364126 RepID=A0ABN9Y7I5_9DINO|nr:unnamed protein product [Polarella glacialis]